MINIPKSSMKKTLKQYLFEYRSAFQKQSFETFHWLIVAIISVQEVRSVKFLYENFIEKYSDKTLNSYLNGHCFVSLVINIPLVYQENIRYLSIPVDYKLYSKDKSKLEIAANLIENIIPLLKGKQVIILSDS